MVKRNFKSKKHKEWRKLALKRDGGCVICSEKILKYCNVHHLVPSMFHKYEFELDNAICLCPNHHTLGKFSAHKNPIWFYEWMLHHRTDQLRIAITRLFNENPVR
jgi:hypothetical protein